MNRRTFFRNLVVGAVTLPALLDAATEPQTRTLLEWLDDIRKEHYGAIFICSSDAVEYFRREFPKSHGGGRVTFSLEQFPYRWNSGGNIVRPYRNDVGPLGRMHAVSDDWLNAPTEICIAIANDTNTVHWAPFNRITFRLRPAK